MRSLPTSHMMNKLGLVGQTQASDSFCPHSCLPPSLRGSCPLPNTLSQRGSSSQSPATLLRTTCSFFPGGWWPRPFLTQLIFHFKISCLN